MWTSNMMTQTADTLESVISVVRRTGVPWYTWVMMALLGESQRHRFNEPWYHAFLSCTGH